MHKEHSNYCKREAFGRLNFALPAGIRRQRADSPPCLREIMLARKQQRLLAKKVFDFMAISPYSAILRHKTANSNHNSAEPQRKIDNLRHKSTELRHKIDGFRHKIDGFRHKTVCLRHKITTLRHKTASSAHNFGHALGSLSFPISRSIVVLSHCSIGALPAARLTNEPIG